MPGKKKSTKKPMMPQPMPMMSPAEHKAMMGKKKKPKKGY